jgi:hypothetical protein
MMTTEERENLVEWCASTAEAALKELEFIGFDLDKGLALTWPPDFERAQESLFQLEITLSQVAERLTNLSRELANEGFTRNYPDGRALANRQ